MEKKRITVEELLRRYAALEQDFQRIILEYADLSGVELQSINLRGARFNYVNLSSINLRSCNLIGAQFYNCNLREVQIISCDLESTWFTDCDLGGANTSRCNLTLTHFIRVNLYSAKIDGFGEEYPWFCDVIREDGKFISGYTIDLYLFDREEVDRDDIAF